MYTEGVESGDAKQMPNRWISTGEVGLTPTHLLHIAAPHLHSDCTNIVIVRMEVTMGFNYGREKRAFDEKWARLEVEYRAAGMSEKAIQDMKNYDWQWFCSERTYRNHVQTLPVGDTESHGDVFFKQARLESITSQWDAGDVDHTRFGWLSALEDETLYNKLRALSDKDLELLTLLCVDGFQQADIARRMNCSRNAVHKRLKKIKKILKKG